MRGPTAGASSSGSGTPATSAVSRASAATCPTARSCTRGTAIPTTARRSRPIGSMPQGVSPATSTSGASRTSRSPTFARCSSGPAAAAGAVRLRALDRAVPRLRAGSREPLGRRGAAPRGRQTGGADRAGSWWRPRRAARRGGAAGGAQAGWRGGRARSVPPVGERRPSAARAHGRARRLPAAAGAGPVRDAGDLDHRAAGLAARRVRDPEPAGRALRPPCRPGVRISAGAAAAPGGTGRARAARALPAQGGVRSRPGRGSSAVRRARASAGRGGQGRAGQAPWPRRVDRGLVPRPPPRAAAGLAGGRPRAREGGQSLLPGSRRHADVRRAFRSVPEPERALPTDGIAVASRPLKLRALDAIADTFAPGSAAQGVPDAFLERLVARLPRSEQARLSALLSLFAARGFHRLPRRRRERILRAWGSSRISLRRTGFHALRKGVLLLAWTLPGAAWDELGYPGPPGPDREAPAKPLEPIAAEGELSCDVCVVGSGAGGGAAAAVLAGGGAGVGAPAR